MSGFGAEFFSADGRRRFAFDRAAGVVIDAFRLDSHSPAGEKVYWDFRNADLRFQRIYDHVAAQGGGFSEWLHKVSVNHLGAHPRILWEPRSSTSKPSTVIVYASGNFRSMASGHHGFVALNPSGGLLVSDLTYNLAYAGEAQYESADREDMAANVRTYTRGAWFVRYVIHGVGPDAPTVFLEPAGAQNEHIGVWSYVYLGGGSWRFSVVVHNSQTTNSTPGPIPRAHVFSRITTAPSGRGMAVYDGSGKICFHTDVAPLVIDDIVDITPPTGRDSTVTASHIPISRPGYFFAANMVQYMGRYTQRINQQNYVLFDVRVPALQSGGSSVHCRLCRVAGGGSSSMTRNRDEYPVFVTDLSRYT